MSQGKNNWLCHFFTSVVGLGQRAPPPEKRRRDGKEKATKEPQPVRLEVQVALAPPTSSRGRPAGPQTILVRHLDVNDLGPNFGVGEISAALSSHLSGEFIICDRYGPILDSPTNCGKIFTSTLSLSLTFRVELEEVFSNICNIKKIIKGTGGGVRWTF